MAELKGWRYKEAGKSAHGWGRLLCPEASRDGCQMSVWSTPRNDENHAKQIMRRVNNCPIVETGQERVSMPHFEFLLIVTGLDPDDDGFEDNLFEAGCDDALVSVMKGCVVLDFTRQEKNLAHAVASAIKDVESTGAKVVRLEPDPFVTISDIANRASLSKQLISLYVQRKRGPKDFPLPSLRISSDSPLWDWLSVARWLRKYQKIDSSRDVVHAALLKKFNNDLAEAKRE